MISKIWRWWKGPKHGPASFDGTHETCRCGYHRFDDWDLKKHLSEVGA